MDSLSQGIVGVAAGQAQLFVTVAGRGGSLLEAGCSSSSPSRGLLVASEGGGWSPASGGSGRRVGESASWAGPYRVDWAETFPFVSFQPK